MSILGCSSVVFNESYILGWIKGRNFFILVTELLLEESHPKYEPFDQQSEYGCYKIGFFVFTSVTHVSGLTSHLKKLKLSDGLEEFEDVFEIDDIELSSSAVKFYVGSDTIEVIFKHAFLSFV